jgi:hypothetical protein
MSGGQSVRRARLIWVRQQPVCHGTPGPFAECCECPAAAVARRIAAE